jgi:hypothetical protein
VWNHNIASFFCRFYASWWGETKDSGMVVKECIDIGFVSHAEFSVALSWCWVETKFMLVDP